MANTEHLEILKQGVKAWNQWRGERLRTQPAFRCGDLTGADLRWRDLKGANFGIVPHLIGSGLMDLMGADLSRTNLSGANLEWAKLQKVDLTDASLVKTNLGGADLRGAYLCGADLTGSNLRGADLAGTNLLAANLRESDLRQADFRGANLGETDFTNSTVGYTNFVGMDLRQAIGLESVTHRGPSEVSIGTIYRSHGKIPELFLRDTGIPDIFLQYMSSLVGKALEYYSCFISYSTKDQEFANRLYADLQSRGVRSWFAPHDVRAGQKLHEQIDIAIRVHEKLLLVLSRASMESEWVKTEIATARQREIREKRRILFPIRLVDFDLIREWQCFDADTGKDTAREIREYFIPNFSDWKDHDSYQQSFGRLIRDLRGEKQIS